MNRVLSRWELIGIPLIVLSGSALHFAFEWSGYWRPLALIAAVNESVWEHLKLAFWPSVFWGLVVHAAHRPDARSFWSAKGFSLLVAPVLIVTIFYGYTSLLGRNILALDIATFVVAIVAGQFVSARLVLAHALSFRAQVAGIALLLLQLVAYSTFTFFPPPLQLFEDGRNGLRGIQLSDPVNALHPDPH